MGAAGALALLVALAGFGVAGLDVRQAHDEDRIAAEEARLTRDNERAGFPDLAENGRRGEDRARNRSAILKGAAVRNALGGCVCSLAGVGLLAGAFVFARRERERFAKAREAYEASRGAG